jgi:hypothetical protein
MQTNSTSAPQTGQAFPHDPIEAALSSIQDLLAVLRAPSGTAALPPARLSPADRL